MVMFPTLLNATTGVLHLLLALADVQELLNTWLKSHTEWVQKTTLDAVNWEISW